MSEKIPTFDLYKKLENDLSVEFDKLEESYHEYDSSHPHRHNYYELLYFHKEGGSHDVDFKRFDVTQNTIHFVSPEQVHLLRRKKNVTGFVLSFTPDVLLAITPEENFLSQFPFFDIGCKQPLIKLNKKENDEFLQLMEQIETEFNEKRDSKKQMLALLIAQLMIFCKRNFKEQQPSGAGNIMVLKFRELINKHFKSVRSVSQYAELLSITPGHLNDTIQKQSGRTASELIHDRVLLEAKRLLYHSSLSVKEIASQLNFEDPSYFSKFFKSNSGQTPEQFRKAIRENYH